MKWYVNKGLPCHIKAEVGVAGGFNTAKWLYVIDESLIDMTSISSAEASKGGGTLWYRIYWGWYATKYDSRIESEEIVAARSIEGATLYLASISYGIWRFAVRAS